MVGVGAEGETPLRYGDDEMVEIGALVLTSGVVAVVVVPREVGHLGQMNLDPKEGADHQIL